MSKLNELLCAENTRNVGFGSCVLDISTIEGILLYDTDRIFSAEELVDLQTTLQADAYEDSPSQRMYPIGNFVNIADNSEDVSITTFDYGSKVINREGNYDWTFRFSRGATCVLNGARTHNGDRYALFYDKNKVIYGRDNLNRLQTIPVLFYAQPAKVATGADTTQYLVRVIFKPNYLNEDSSFVKVDFDPAAIDGLQDIKLLVNSFNASTGVANVSVQQLCGALDLYSLYNAELVAALWKATNATSGSVIAITSVAPDNSTATFNVTIDTADPDYPGDGGIISLQLVAPSVLADAGVEGYEAVVSKIVIAAS
jgi:hypothetical protein